MDNEHSPNSSYEVNKSPPSGDLPMSRRDDTRDESIDDVLTNIGPCGRFQIILEISMILVTMSTSYNFMLSYFTADDPSWKCVNRNSSHFCQLYSNQSIHSSSDMFEERCKMNREDWSYITSKKYSLITEFDLVCTKTSIAAFSSSAVYMGGIIGSIISGTLSDTYGRKPVIVLSLFATICSSVGCTFVNTIWQFAGLNVLLGAAVVACYFTTIVYISEFASPKYRTLLCNIVLLASTVSFMFMDALAYFERDWRSLQRYLSISTIAAFIVSIFLPESPRWLLANGMKSKAVNVLGKIGRFNGNRSCGVNLKSTCVTNQQKYTYIQFCRNHKVVILTLCIGTLWVTVPIVEYSIALESSKLGGDMYQAFAFSTLADFPAVIMCTYICDRFGRKKCILGGLFTSGIIVGLIAIIPRSISYRYVINIVMMTSARFVNVTAFFGIYTWTFELYPTVVRSQGMAVCAAFERIGLISVPFITDLLQKVNYVLPFLLICALAIVASLIGMFLPETNKLPTREKYDDFYEMKTGKISFGNGVDNNTEDEHY